MQSSTIVSTQRTKYQKKKKASARPKNKQDITKVLLYLVLLVLYRNIGINLGRDPSHRAKALLHLRVHRALDRRVLQDGLQQ